MSDESIIREALAEAGLSLVGAIIRDASESPTHYVPISVHRNADNRQVPSNIKLHDVRKMLGEKGLVVQFLLRNSAVQDLEVDLRATLLHGFIDDLRHVFLSVSDGVASVWLEPKRIIDDERREQIRERVAQHLQNAKVQLGVISTTSDPSLPSKFACLLAIRKSAPISLDMLTEQLTKKGFVVPSPKWLSRRLDTLRKAGKIVRLENGSYALSRRGLFELGTVKGRLSPDISRLLAIARGGR